MVECPYCGNPCEYLTTKAVGQLLGLDVRRVRERIRSGRIPAEVVEGVTNRYEWRIPISAVLPLVKEQQGVRD